VKDCDVPRLANEQLELAVLALERDADFGRFNGMCTIALGNAAKLLNHSSALVRAEKLLGTTPAQAFWDGVITNVDMAATDGRPARSFQEIEILKEEYPHFDEQCLRGMIAERGRTERHISLCLCGEFRKALEESNSEFLVQEIASTIAVLGHLKTASDVARGSLSDRERKRSALLVIAIESVRQRDMGNLPVVLRELEAEGLTAWDRIALALGFSQRRPWEIYPYSDY
jgi:hypothetical protein